MHVVSASMLLDISRDFEGYRKHREESWYGYTNNGSTWGAVPFSAAYLYRGQTSRYIPLLPSIARDLNSSEIAQLWEVGTSDQAKIILRIAQSWWFSQELMYHPIASHAQKLHLDFDDIALAQHYGIATGYLDLTDDFSVSAFFATCHLNGGSWEPVDAGTGVIYRVDRKDERSLFARYTPLGPQRLPRPSEQCAWVVELPMCHSFEGWPGVSMLQFQHDRNVGEYFLNLFEGGELLFPKDLLASVSEEILTCGELPVELLDAAIESFASDPLGLRPSQVGSVRKEISKLVALTSNRRLLTPEHVSSLTSNPHWCSQMLADVKAKWRPVRRIPIEPE